MMTTILLIIGAVLFLLLAMKRLDWALLLIIATLPSYLLRFNVGVPTTALEVMIWLSMAVFVAKNWTSLRARIKSHWVQKAINGRYPFDWEIVVVLAVAWLAVLVASDTQAALGIFKAYFFDAIVFYILYINVLGQKKDWPRVMRAVAVSAVAVSAVAWYQQFVDMSFINPIWSQQKPPRATSFFPYANALGLYLGPIVLLLVAYAKDVKTSLVKSRYGELWMIMAAVVMSLGAIYFARSEGALLGVAVGLVVLGIWASAKSRLVMTVLVLVSLIVALVLPASRAVIWQKATLSDLAGEIRKQQWRETKKMLLASPQKALLGAGLSGYPAAVKPVHQEGIFFDFDQDSDFQKNLKASAEYRATHWQPVDIYQYPHNIILNFWTELGVLGVLIFGYLLLKFLYYASLLYSKTGDLRALGLLAGMLCVLVHGLVDVPYFKNDLTLLWWLMFGMLGTLILDYERSITKNNRG